MPLMNSAEGYGALPKLLHWTVAALFAFQLLSALVMTRLDEHGVAIGLARDGWYNWHKSIGLLALVVAGIRLWARRAGELPPWAPGLTDREKRLVHRAEQVLYLCMFVMPVSGFAFVMLGGYGVQFAGAFTLPNPLPQWQAGATVAQYLHVAAAVLLLAALAAHLGVVLRHSLLLRDGLLRRMLPAPRRADGRAPP